MKNENYYIGNTNRKDSIGIASGALSGVFWGLDTVLAGVIL